MILRRATTIVLLCALCSGFLSLAAPMAGAIAAGDIVITEIMYDPASDIDGDEFLELHNPTGATVDLTGVCIDGIDYCFPAAASIGAGDYIVLSPDPARTSTTYGVLGFGAYAGGLKNGGEDISVLDAAGNVIDFVDYDDNAPWPKTPDGLGPSLELVDVASDNNDWLNWAASTAPSGSTPGIENAVARAGLGPRITTVSGPVSPVAPGTSLLVTAQIADATSVSLEYRIDWEPVQTLPMTADAGGYQATIPGQVAGAVVRYRVVADNAVATSRVPRTDDTIAYQGVSVSALPVSSQLPVLEWLIEEDAYDRLVDDPFSEQFETAILVYDNVVYDSVSMRVRGSNSRNAPKVSFKVEMPKGHDMDFGALLAEPIDEFAMQADWSDHSHARTTMAWDTYEAAGLPAAQTFKLRVERNGSYQGMYSYLDIYDGTWRDREGYDSGELYKAQTSGFDDTQPLEENRWDKKNPKDEDYTTLLTLLDGVALPTAAARADYIHANFDLPKLANYAAVTAMIDHQDSSSKNFYTYFDTEGTQRWEMIPWDLNHTFGDGCCGVVTDFLTPADPADKTNDILNAAFESPAFVDMFFRRLRTVVDEFYGPGQYEQVLDDLMATYAIESALDYAEWPHPFFPQTARNALFVDFAERRTVYANAPEVPPSQPANAAASIDSVVAAPAQGDGAEVIALSTPSATGVDLTGWSIPEIDHTFQPGAVIPPNTTVYLVGDDPTFRSINDPTAIVLGTYGGGLDDAGDTLTLRRPNGSIAASLAYGAPDDNDPETVLTSPAASPVSGPDVTFTGSALDDIDVSGVVLLILNEDTGEFLYNDGTTGPFAGPAFLIASLSNDQGTTTDWNYNANLQNGNWRAYAATVGAGFIFDPTGAALSFTVTSNPGPDTENPNATITTPTPFQTITGPTITIEGTATDNIAIDRVAVAIRDRTTNLWLQPNGTYGPWTQLPATLTGGTPTNTTWQFTTTLTPNNYEIVAYTWDTTNNNDPTKARTKFTIN